MKKQQQLFWRTIKMIFVFFLVSFFPSLETPKYSNIM